MTRCLSRATVIRVRLDMKAAMQGTVCTNLEVNIFNKIFLFFFKEKDKNRTYRQYISCSEKGNVLVILSLMVKGSERARMRSENARLKIKIFRADLVLSLMTAIRTRPLLTTKII